MTRLASLCLIPKRKMTPSESLLMINITGVSTTMSTDIKPAIESEILSAFMVASVFGETSPKISMRNVSIPVATPAPTLPNSLMASDVVSDDAERFTMLLPIRMAESIFGEFSVTLSTFSAFLLPASARVLMRILFTVVRAVSEDEKNAESANNINKNIICDMSSASKYFTSLYELINVFIYRLCYS